MTKGIKTVLFAMTAGLAACSENTMAPRAEAPESPTSVYGGGASASLTPFDTVRFSITIDPSRQTYFYLGAGNSLTFPAGSLCDPYRSSYGDTEWDKPCTKATSPLTVNGKAWLDAKGHARVDFDKHVRFVPSANPAQWVVITFADLQASVDPFFNILYCPSTTSGCTDESKTDATLLVRRDPVTGRITRRIKHFSGYNVAAGADDVRSYNLGANTTTRPFSVAAVSAARPTGVEMLLAGVRFVRRGSGYILASG